MVTVMAFALLFGALTVPTHNAKVVTKKLTKNDVTKVKAFLVAKGYLVLQDVLLENNVNHFMLLLKFFLFY